ncbi:hypothetical protein D910_08708 [Dendroctonus ponderosae]
MSKNEILVTRPPHMQTKKGVDGKGILLRANFFELVSAEKWTLNVYHVTFNPPVEDTRIRKKLVYTGLQQRNVSGYLFDGTVIYTPVHLSSTPTEPLEFVVNNEVTKENIYLHISFVSVLGDGNWQYLQVFNIIIRKCFALMGFSLLGRNYFDSKLKVTLAEHNLEVWPGFLTSMRQFERSIMLNVDLSFKVVLRLDTVYDVFMECQRARDPRHEFLNKIIGSIVLTKYNNKTYKVDDVDFSQTAASSFKLRDGKPTGSDITYIKYYENRYKLHVKIKDQPILISRSKPREIRAGMPEIVALLPEFCSMTGLTDRQRENFQLMKAMGDHTRVNPGERMDKLLRFIDRLRGCPGAVAEVKKWDLQLADKLVEFPGRVMPTEVLYLKNNLEINGGEEADWTRSLRSSPIYNAANIDRLAVIFPRRMESAINAFMPMLEKAAAGMQIRIKGRKFPIQEDKPHNYLSELDRVITSQECDMVLVAVPNNSGDRYNAIKKKCYVDRAMPCQVMTNRSLNNKGLMSIATKVAIQMTCKMGGAPWGACMPKNIMVCGYDVCRDTANRGKSFAGMVASMDEGCTQYFNATMEHAEEQELSNTFASFLVLACTEFRTRRKVLPDRIIIYRDAVGDGQIKYVKEHEVDTIKQKLTELFYTTQPLKMAYIVVSKRINAKIFRSQPSQRRDFNPPPGTVVDDVITLPERYDFYLVSQCVRQGTVSPTSYNVIEDTLGINANKIQRFTYKMCHMYFNWSGTIAVPAPCQYAHKLAFITAQSLHRYILPFTYLAKYLPS